ncbi:MAG: hypothetical protein ACYC4U_33330 [Pirellulaceae bacterium]
MFNTCTWARVSLVALAAAWSASDSARGAQVEAVPGQPWGVAEVTVDYPPEDALDSTLFSVTSADGRVVYPAFDGLRRRLRYLSGPPPRFLTVMFLFQGDDPFEVTIRTPTAQTVPVVPSSGTPGLQNRLLRRWWRAYSAFLRDQSSYAAYPPVVETYLASMLARRLDLPAPWVEQFARQHPRSEGRQTLELLSGAEALRMEILKSTYLGLDLDTQPARLPPPSAPAWRQLTFEAIPEDIAIEPMAKRVPHECFYVRFGQYANYIWLNALIEDYGGDIRSMISARGVRSSFNARVQEQLALKQGILAQLLGPQAIADVALIGMDTFAREGAAVGVLFEAKNRLLEADLVRQRQEALVREQDNGASIVTSQIAGRDVSFLSTPDNRLRSYYLIDGSYQLVTNSRRIVQRFLEVREGTGSLGESPEFRHARAAVPTAREDTIFVYFSAAFFENLLSPQYQIELNRRLRAATDLEHVMLAQLAARHEGRSGESVDELVDAQFLPAGVGDRPDGSKPVMTDGRIVDSLRGAQGFFTPVPDLNVSTVSQAEHDRFVTHSAYYASHWQQMDPLLAAIKRYALPDQGRERITIDAILSPLDDTKYAWYLSLLGEPTKYQLVPPTDNLISIEAALRGGLLFPGVPPHTLFLGIQNQATLQNVPLRNAPRLLEIFRTLPGYLGAWPKPGFLDLLPFNVAGTPTSEGLTRVLLGIWRWQGRGFSVLSFEPAVLEAVERQIGFVETDTDVQVRVRIGDLSQAHFRDWLDSWGYTRGRKVSAGNARLLAILTQQLGVPQVEALKVAHELFGAHLHCPLGGEYQLLDDPRAATWQSTAATTDGGGYQAPADYSAPLLEWFRGLEAELTRSSERIVLRAHLDLRRKERDAAWDLPRFDFGEKSTAEPAEDRAKTIARPPAEAAEAGGSEGAG